jgi:hypothetical protein
VIGDLTGFAAAILKRGCNFIQLPTSLLAQVDSSSAARPRSTRLPARTWSAPSTSPALVLADLAVLDTLPERELLAGYAEVVKYGLIGDADFFAWCDANGAAMLAGDGAAREYAVAHSVAHKARIVAEDERETTGPARPAQSRPHLRPRAGGRDRLFRPPAARRGGGARHGPGRAVLRAARPDAARQRRAHRPPLRRAGPACGSCPRSA